MPGRLTLLYHRETLLLKRLETFRADENGAATVDWVILLAALVTLALTVGAVDGSGTRTTEKGDRAELSQSMPALYPNEAG